MSEEQLINYMNNIDFENTDEVYKIIESLYKKNNELQQENQKLKEQNELEFNDFVNFRKEQEDRHLEKTNKLIKENHHLKKQLKQGNEVIDEAIKHVQSLSSKGRDCMIYADVKKDILDILKKYKKEGINNDINNI